MKIAVWRTGHEIADTVAEAVLEGLFIEGIMLTCASPLSENIEKIIEDNDVHIGYGILRGMDKVYRLCNRITDVWTNIPKPWFCLDRGYWKPGHYEGYYRVSLNGTQQTIGLDKLEPDYARWDALGIEVLPAKVIPQRKPDLFPRKMICPPTDHVKEFFKCNFSSKRTGKEEFHIREKGTSEPLQEWLDWCDKIETFNSSVGWEALRQGIPVISDPTSSIVGAFAKMYGNELHKSIELRRDLFSKMASLQLTLAEVRQGQLWPVLEKLLSIQ